MGTIHVHEAGDGWMARSSLLIHLLTDHDSDDDALFTAVGQGLPALRAYHEKFHPVDKPAVVRFKYYLHDDGYQPLYDHLTGPSKKSGATPMSASLAGEIAAERPFYEVTLTVDYDTASKKFTIVEAEL